MEVKTIDYKGSERRNGGKLKVSGGDVIRIVLILITMIAGGVAGWVTLSMKVNAMANEVVKVEENEKDIISIKSDIGNIKEDVQEMKSEQRTFAKETRESLQKILLEVKK